MMRKFLPYIIMCLAMCSCRSYHDVSDYVMESDTIHKYITHYDTIRHIDSIYIKVKNYGDTLLHVYEYHHVTDLQKSEINDSVNVMRNKVHDKVITESDSSDFNVHLICFLLLLLAILLILFLVVKRY